MMHDLTLFTAVLAEHQIRVRNAERFLAAEAALRAGHGRTPRTPLRRLAGAALVSLGQRLGGTPPPAAGGLGRVAG